MILGIMQPYFLPYLGYYSIINQSEEFILLDTVQYIRHGWINRNRILKPGEGWQYVSVPLEKHSRNTLISEIRISHNTDWKIRIMRQLEHYKKRAKYYQETMNLLEDIFQIETDSITEFNFNCLKGTCEYIGISTEIRIFSEMQLDIGSVEEPDDWAFQISKSIGAKEYINPASGEEIFDKMKYKQSGIEIKFLQLDIESYNQRRGYFEPGLSIIDALMFNTPDEVFQLINNHRFVTSS